MFEILRERLKASVQKNKSHAMLFSGGLDTSILAFLLSDLGVSFEAITVSLEGKAEDVHYAQRLAKDLGIQLTVLNVKMEEAIASIRDVVKILKTFDPAIPNDLAIFFGMRFAKENGFFSVMTGDGSDELFAGYSYMSEIKDLNGYIASLLPDLHFNSTDIGNALGLKVVSPFLDESVVTFALECPKELKIKDGHGKWILRKSFEGFLPNDILWQKKRPIEVGSGMSLLKEELSSSVTDKEYEEKSLAYGMTFFGKDHLRYFEIYMDIVGFIPEPKEGERRCPNCKGGKRGKHCRICGFMEDL